MWNEVPEEREPRAREIEEQVELRRRSKSLVDCALPEGFRLVTERPKQYWIHNQLVWGFKLAWARVKNGIRGNDEYSFVARYYPTIADEVQMRWALDEFSRELEDQQSVDREKMREFLPAQVKVDHRYPAQMTWPRLRTA